MDVLEPRRRGAMVVFALGLLLAGCASVGIKDGVVYTPETRYRVGPIPADWHPVSLKDSDLAWVTEPAGYAFWVDSTCKNYQDVPLVALNRQLLIGFSDVEKEQQETQVLDGREALRSRYRVKLDGVARELALVVLKKDGCIYDFAYVAPVGRFPDRLAQFQALVAGFATEKPK